MLIATAALAEPTRLSCAASDGTNFELLIGADAQTVAVNGHAASKVRVGADSVGFSIPPAKDIGAHVMGLLTLGIADKTSLINISLSRNTGIFKMQSFDAPAVTGTCVRAPERVF